jgi:hypothetical protein
MTALEESGRDSGHVALTDSDPSPTYGQKDDAAQNTIGIVCVSRLTAAVPGVPLGKG